MRRVKSVNSLIIIKERAAAHEGELRLWKIKCPEDTPQHVASFVTTFPVFLTGLTSESKLKQTQIFEPIWEGEKTKVRLQQ